MAALRSPPREGHAAATDVSECCCSSCVHIFVLPDSTGFLPFDLLVIEFIISKSTAKHLNFLLMQSLGFNFDFGSRFLT